MCPKKSGKYNSQRIGKMTMRMVIFHVWDPVRNGMKEVRIQVPENVDIVTAILQWRQRHNVNN